MTTLYSSDNSVTYDEHCSGLNTFKKAEIIQNIIFSHNGIKSENGANPQIRAY